MKTGKNLNVTRYWLQINGYPNQKGRPYFRFISVPTDFTTLCGKIREIELVPRDLVKYAISVDANYRMMTEIL